MPSRAPYWNRKLHRLGALLAAAPLAVIIVTGVLLLLKKEVDWIQPPTARGTAAPPTLAFESILAAAQQVPEAAISSWDDIDRLDVRPGRGVIKVRARNRWEVQLDASSGELLHVAYRRSDLLESLHDGSWFHESVKLWLFLPAALLLACLWASGIYLWLLPHLVRRRRARLTAPPAPRG